MVDQKMETLIAVTQSTGKIALILSGPTPDEEIAAAERELEVRFPNSYRAFLRQFGTGSLGECLIFGIPRHRVWGDIVMMNQLAPARLPAHFIKFTNEVDGRAFYFDTSRMSRKGECPVIALGPGERVEFAADSFLDFLRMACDGTTAPQQPQTNGDNLSCENNDVLRKDSDKSDSQQLDCFFL